MIHHHHWQSHEQGLEFVHFPEFGTVGGTDFLQHEKEKLPKRKVQAAMQSFSLSRSAIYCSQVLGASDKFITMSQCQDHFYEPVPRSLHMSQWQGHFWKLVPYAYVSRVLTRVGVGTAGGYLAGFCRQEREKGTAPSSHVLTCGSLSCRTAFSGHAGLQGHFGT
jgi:hypothetical protein